MGLIVTKHKTTSHIVELVKIGLVTNDVTKNPLSSEQMNKLQEVIIDTACEFGAPVYPEFKGCFPRTGWLMVSYTNRETTDRLKVNTIKEKSKIEVNIVEEAEFPRSHFVRGYFPHSQDVSNEKVLATINGQNKLLNSNLWKVVMRKNYSSARLLRRGPQNRQK